MAWFLAKSAGAPVPLRDRAGWYVEAVGEAGGTGGVPGALAAAGLDALGSTIRSSGDRSAALDLLAADALVTLALLAQSEADPVGLATFARQLRDQGVVQP
jgi:hypothetical protein